MENVFGSLTTYGEKWNKIAERNFNENEINAVKSATVVPSDYGMSVCFAMKAGGSTYIPVSKVGYQPAEGETVDLQKVKLVTLERSGDGQRIRVEF